MWHSIGTLKKEEVIFRQQLLHAKSGSSKKTKEKVFFLQEKLNTLANRFEESEMNVQEYLQGLSLLVAKDIKMKKSSFVFFAYTMLFNGLIYLFE